MKDLTLQSLGSAMDIGASCHAISDGERTLLLDCGMHPREEGRQALPAFDALVGPTPASVVITHGHHDHVGGLPIAVQRWPDVSVLLSDASAMVSRRMLRNAASLLARRATPDAPPLFTMEAIDEVARRFKTIDLHDTVSLHGRPVRGESAARIKLHPAGHVLGATSVEIQWAGRTLWYTGDLHLGDQELLLPAECPAHVDVLLMEGTLGAEPGLDALNREDEARRFGKACGKVLRAGGSVLAPSFALGRTQEMLAMVDRLMQRGELPPVPIYIGGLGAAITELHDAARHLYPMRQPSLVLGELGARVLEHDHADREDPFREPSLYLVTSGMLNAKTPSWRLAQRLLSDPAHGLFFVGYVDRSADGFPLYEAQRGDVVQWSGSPEPIKVQADIQRFRFSGHAKRADLVEMAASLQPRQIFLVHGSAGALRSLQGTLQERLPQTDIQLAWPGRVHRLASG